MSWNLKWRHRENLKAKMGDNETRFRNFDTINFQKFNNNSGGSP